MSPYDVTKLLYPRQKVFPTFHPESLELLPKVEQSFVEPDPTKQIEVVDYMTSHMAAETNLYLWFLTDGRDGSRMARVPRPKGFEFLTESTLFARLAKNHAEMSVILPFAASREMFALLLWLNIHYRTVQFSIWFGTPQSYIYLTLRDPRYISARFRTVKPTCMSDLHGRLQFRNGIFSHESGLLWAMVEHAYLNHFKPNFERMFSDLKERLIQPEPAVELLPLIEDIDWDTEEVTDESTEVLSGESTPQSRSGGRKLPVARDIHRSDCRARPDTRRTSPPPCSFDDLLYTAFQCRKAEAILDRYRHKYSYGRRFVADDESDSDHDSRVYHSDRPQYWVPGDDDG